ncbi:hypothetical protein D9599_28600 [Roseomonas sp. KE2513]|uniref:hypothetical protein n=1 Tax=Roseomonas sp. KE2513 TaxID=2479202 RepID=UPI0018DF2E59|nr:hypothetical protein [Roseomonas sp. KE2513]MBI0539479.1 hypothetical protein [Roseomonas sp. KE2513]
MSYDHLYRPEPCTSWPAAQLRAVGITYREAAGQGRDAAACLERAVAAYVAAGGARQGSTRAVLDMIASLAMEEGDWLWGPALALRDRQARADRQPDLFEPPADGGAPC